MFGAFNIPAMRMAIDGIPVYERAVLVSRAELGEELVGVMGASEVCLMRGHGITVVGETVQQAVVRAVNLNALFRITVELARLGATPADQPPEDLAELPDLGSGFNDDLVWNALVAEADT